MTALIIAALYFAVGGYLAGTGHYPGALRDVVNWFTILLIILAWPVCLFLVEASHYERRT